MNNYKGKELIEILLEKELISKSDIYTFEKKNDEHDPENIRAEMEDWYNKIGIETVTGGKLVLSSCPFTREEIKKEMLNNNVVLCVPKEITRVQLGKLFRLDSWALGDNLVGKSSNRDFDEWFITSTEEKPPYFGITGKEARRKFEDEGYVGLNLERYLVFLARMKFLTGNYPDYRSWTWLISHKYDLSSYLIAGFDSNLKLSMHGWKAGFSANFTGARYAKLSDRIS